ncbi:MAG TPA: SRPBCC family protein [Streptosporangiaceae bacterium]|nr:SRPBCC family protein [Streptosporangiaceae bacterium]
MKEHNVVASQVVEPVRHAVTVPLASDAAFRLFTTDFNSWWPAHHIGEADLEKAIIEPAVGGRWYERGVDGSECDWGEVLTYDPPSRIVLRWQLDGEWKYDADPAHGSEVEVTFTPDGPGRTKVQLEHRHFERHGSQGQAVHDGVGGDGGWAGLLQLYADKAVA